MYKIALFPLGKTLATPGALQLLEENDVDPSNLIDRHAAGDWGIVSKAHWKENDFSLKNGFRILSAYKVGTEKVWIITEADRSSTCILLPSEY